MKLPIRWGVEGKMIRLSALLAAVFVSILSPQLPRAAAPPLSPWGRGHLPIPDTAKIVLELNKPQYFVGENVLLHFTVENTGDAPFVIDVGGDYRGATRHLRFIVTAFDEQGNELEDPDPNPMCMGGIGGPQTIPPGGKWSHSLPLLRYRRFDAPGTYTIRAWHDLGWKEDETRKRPVGETTITFIMPTPPQAEALIDAMLNHKPANDWISGKKRSDFVDFSLLRAPIYLPPLVNRAEQGTPQAIEGIGSIETLDATRALIDLLNPRSTVTARMLAARLPDPTWAGYDAATQPWLARQLRLTDKSWDDKLAPALRPKARQLVASTREEIVELGARMLKSVGTADDQADLLKALDRALSINTPRSGENANVLDPPGSARQLLPALLALRQRGVAVPDDPTTPGEIALYLAAITADPAFRPDGWQAHSIEWLAHANPFIRQSALRAQPMPIPPDARAKLPELLADADNGVLRAACEYAQKLGDRALVPGVLRAVATARETFTIAAANEAALALGAKADACQIWVARIDEPKMLYPALSFLAKIVKYPGAGTSGNTNVSAEEIARLKQRWQQFLPQHRERIQSGQLFEIGDPVLTPDLFAPVFAFGLKGGGEWPPRKL